MISAEDQHAIEHLHACYVHAADRGDLALMRTLYTDDAIEVHGDYEGPVDGFIELLRPGYDYFLSTVHIVTNVLAHVDGDTAESEARGCGWQAIRPTP